MNFKEYLQEYAERELKLIGFMESEFGSVCLNFLDKCADIVGNDPNASALQMQNPVFVQSSQQEVVEIRCR